MAARPPRHLAERPVRFGRPRPQVVFLAALASIALLTLVIGLATRGEAPTPRGAPATTAAQGGGGGATVTTAPAGKPIRSTPGNLLQGGDFERDLAGWAPLGGARLQRVQGGISGHWAVAIEPGAGSDGPVGPGLTRRALAGARAGATYEASVWVRATVPDAQVVLALQEQAGGRVASSDTAAYGVPDDGWRQLAVEHRSRVSGSSLVLEISGVDLPTDGRLLVDLVNVQEEEE
ncbi:MAG TPA: hypothetical protein VF880_18500 [Actinomycetes bacterium]